MDLSGFARLDAATPEAYNGSMPAFAFNLSAESLAELVDSECYFGDYKPLINGVANPESKNAFARRMFVERMKQRITEYRKQQAEIAAKAAVSVVTPDIT